MKTNGKTKKKQHALLPAQVSGREDWNRGADNRVGKTGAHEGKKSADLRNVRRQRQWCLGSEEPIVPSHAWQNDVKASVGLGGPPGRFLHSATTGAFVLNGTNGYHEKKQKLPRIVR